MFHFLKSDMKTHSAVAHCQWVISTFRFSDRIYQTCNLVFIAFLSYQLEICLPCCLFGTLSFSLKNHIGGAQVG